MRAAVFLEPNQPLTVEELSPLDPAQDEVVVRLLASGVCHTDRSKVDGFYPSPPSVLGHEGVGIVEWVGSDVRNLRVGERVVGSLIPTCHDCWFCHHDQSNLCERVGPVATKGRYRRSDGTELAASNGLGTFASEMTASQDSLVKVETDLPDTQLALIGCALTTGVASVFEIGQVGPGMDVAVIGCGGVGQAVVQGARLAGANRIIAVDPIEMKREMALAVGATEAIDPGVEDVVDVVRSRTGGRGADVTFDVVGAPVTVRQAVEAARAGGTAVAIGMLDPRSDVSLPSAGFLYGKRFMGAPYGGAQVRREFPRVVNFMERGLLNVESMVTNQISLDDVNDAFRAMDDGEVIRTVIVPES